MKDKPTLTYQLPTQSCLSHTWGKPPFPHEASDHCGIDRFYNLQKPLTPFDRKGLLKWLATVQVDDCRVASHFNGPLRSKGVSGFCKL